MLVMLDGVETEVPAVKEMAGVWNGHGFFTHPHLRPQLKTGNWLEVTRLNSVMPEFVMGIIEPDRDGL